jgi:hypothetical protein
MNKANRRPNREELKTQRKKQQRVHHANFLTSPGMAWYT